MFQEQATAIGISKKDSSYLLALLGFANTLGRILLGFISDKPWVNRLMVYNVCLTVCGIGKRRTFFFYQQFIFSGKYYSRSYDYRVRLNDSNEVAFLWTRLVTQLSVM